MPVTFLQINFLRTDSPNGNLSTVQALHKAAVGKTDPQRSAILQLQSKTLPAFALAENRDFPVQSQQPLALSRKRRFFILPVEQKLPQNGTLRRR